MQLADLQLAASVYVLRDLEQRLALLRLVLHELEHQPLEQCPRHDLFPKLGAPLLVEIQEVLDVLLEVVFLRRRELFFAMLVLGLLRTRVI